MLVCVSACQSDSICHFSDGNMRIPFHYVKEHQVIIRKTNLVFFSCCTPRCTPCCTPCCTPFHTPFHTPFLAIVWTQKNNTETPSFGNETRSRHTDIIALLLHQFNASPPRFQIFSKIHHLGDKRIMGKGRMGLHQIIQGQTIGNPPSPNNIEECASRAHTILQLARCLLQLQFTGFVFVYQRLDVI